MTEPVILWFRQDLRLADQAAVRAAAHDGPVIPVYVLDDHRPGRWRMGAAQRWWLHHSLTALAGKLAEKGLRLILRRGPAAAEIDRLAAETGAVRIHAMRHYEPWWIAAEDELVGRRDLCLHDGNYLVPPETVITGGGDGYRMFAPFWRTLAGRMPPDMPRPAPRDMTAPHRWPVSDRLDDWALTPSRPDWATGFAEMWRPGETGARRHVDAFIERAPDYGARRDLPAVAGTSRLSPHLHFGELSPAALWHRLPAGADTFRRELAWRDFAAGLIRQRPDYADANGRDRFDRLGWRSGRDAKADLRAWQRGRTGYPIVDAGMRELWTTGWMHNRVRMIAASFLVKHLLIDWRRGEDWFWDALVDADFGNNSVNWQWVAGTGIDSNMFGRIMAPLVQSAKFDAAAYIRSWVPELAHMNDAGIHDPWGAGRAPAGYAEPLIGHREGRERALAAYAQVKG